MNLQIIKNKVEELRYPGGVKGLAEAVGMTEQNLHRCVRENKIQAQDLERIATQLKVSIAIFFGESNVEVRQAGMDYIEHDHSKHSGSEYKATTMTIGASNNSDLQKENDDLRRKLIVAQEKIIDLLQNKK